MNGVYKVVKQCCRPNHVPCPFHGDTEGRDCPDCEHYKFFNVPEECDNCSFFKYMESECRRHSPVNGIDNYAVWPKVSKTDLCGDYQPKKEE